MIYLYILASIPFWLVGFFFFVISSVAMIAGLLTEKDEKKLGREIVGYLVTMALSGAFFFIAVEIIASHV